MRIVLVGFGCQGIKLIVSKTTTEGVKNVTRMLGLLTALAIGFHIFVSTVMAIVVGIIFFVVYLFIEQKFKNKHKYFRRR